MAIPQSLSAQKIRYEDRRSLNAINMSPVYAGVGLSFQNPVRTIMFDNLTDADLDISFDGITDKTIVPAQSGRVIDYGSNMATQAGNLEQQIGDRVYVKVNPESAGPTNGKSLYVTVIYASIQ